MTIVCAIENVTQNIDISSRRNIKGSETRKKHYVISRSWHVVYFNLRVLFLNTLRS